MRTHKEGFRVAIVGASSLLGKELMNLLEEEEFPVSRLVTFQADEEEADLPIVDLREGGEISVKDQDVWEPGLDYAFVAALPRDIPSFLSSLRYPAAAAEQKTSRCVVIDLTGEGFGERPGNGSSAGPRELVSIASLDRRFPAAELAPGAPALYVSPHPAVIIISSLLLRLAARFQVKRAVAQLFGSASECGPRGIEELQRQTVNLLSFQKIPQQVFGGQLAFNLLSRLGRTGSGEVAALESRLRRQLRQYLGSRVPLPALRLFHVPIFYAVGVSLYVETQEPVAPERAAAALASDRIRVRKPSQDAPTPVEVTGSSDILVDNITCDADHPNGLWIWAVADNLHLAAMNAVEIAAALRERIKS